MEANQSASAGGSTPSATIPSPPERFIYTQADMDAFRASPAKRELLSFVTAMGRSCSQSSSGYRYDPSNPLVGVSPGMASLHGSLRHMADHWLKDIPPDADARARFGNPAFRTWHARLVDRSKAVVQSVLDCHKEYVAGGKEQQKGWEFDVKTLEKCSASGYNAASGTSAAPPTTGDAKEEAVLFELIAYLHDSFGHPTRLDYGTGHECSFLVFLFALCKIGCFGQQKDQSPPPAALAPVALSVMSQYLQVTRGLQTDYILEPAGSHGVWGLDDYHCVPFYFGACQLQNDPAGYTPDSIHNNDLLKEKGDEYMYFGCIAYIKRLKKGVPFFESSPMLDDISHLASWMKVSGGLLRLYEGEVLDKMPVVQHFVFGNIYKATWTPSQKPREAPTRTFINGPGGDECIAPWAQNSPARPPSQPTTGGGGLPPATRAPWAK